MEVREILTALNQEIRKQETETEKLRRLRDAASELPGKFKAIETREDTLSGLDSEIKMKKQSLASIRDEVTSAAWAADIKIAKEKERTNSEIGKLVAELSRARKVAEDAIEDHNKEMESLRAERDSVVSAIRKEVSEVRDALASEKSKLEKAKREYESFKSRL